MWKLLLPLIALLALLGASVLSDRPLPRADFWMERAGTRSHRARTEEACLA